MDCYVEDGYWDVGYTEQDVCGIAQRPRGDDAFRSSGAREAFWRKRAEEALEEQLEALVAVSGEGRSETSRRRVARRFRAKLEQFDAAPVVANNLPLISEVLREFTRPRPDYTALAVSIMAAQEAIARERIKARRKRDIEALLVMI
jgi:hypothetical protein